MSWFGKDKVVGPEGPTRSEVIKTRLAEIQAEIEGAEAALHECSLEAALGENVEVGEKAIQTLATLRGRQELLSHALTQAQELEGQERDAERLVEHKARRRAAAQHAGSLERAAKAVTAAQKQLIDAYGQMVGAAGSLVAVVPSTMRTDWQSLLSEFELRRMVKIEGHRLNREGGPELFPRTGTSTGAVESQQPDGYTIPNLHQRVSELTARLKQHFDSATPGANSDSKAEQPAPTEPKNEELVPPLNIGSGTVPGSVGDDVAPLTPPVANQRVDEQVGFVNLRGKDLGVKKQPHWTEALETCPPADQEIANV